MKLSIVIPVYNFEKRLGESVKTLGMFYANYKSRNEGLEIIFVDDGSTDNTRFLLSKMMSPFRSIHLDRNQGKGAAIKAGMADARGEYIFFTDIDIPYDLEAIDRAFVEFQKGHGIVSGSRYLAGSSSTQPRKLVRRLSSKVFSSLANLVLISHVADTQCGFKGFRSEVAKDIFSEIRSSGFTFDVEMFYHAQKKQIPTAFIPVLLIDNSDSSVHVFKDSIKMSLDIFKLYIRTHHAEIKRFIRYGLTGVFNMLLNLAVLNILMISTGIYQGYWVTFFSAISFAVVITAAFFVNAYWVFKRRDRVNSNGYKRFFLVSGGVAVANIIFIHILVNFVGAPFGLGAHVWVNIVTLMTVVISVLGNYTGYRLFVFK